MKLHENQNSLASGYEMVVPASVIALKSIVNFWSYNMQDVETEYQRPPVDVQRSLDNAARHQAKVARGEIWRKVNAEIAKSGLPNTAENRSAIYKRLANET